LYRHGAGYGDGGILNPDDARRGKFGDCLMYLFCSLMAATWHGGTNMRDCDVERAVVGEPDFNLLLIADPYEPWRFRIEGTIRIGHPGDPYEELEARLRRLLLIRGVGVANGAAKP
jgi:hypothetical protein